MMIDIRVPENPGKPWRKPLIRAILAIGIGIYGQLFVLILLAYVIGDVEQTGPMVALRILTILIECVVLFFLIYDHEPITKYIHIRQPLKIFFYGLIAALPLFLANRIMFNQEIRIVGEQHYFAKIIESELGGAIFLVLQYVYYFLEAFVLVYAYDRLAAALRAWRPISRLSIMAIGAIFLFITWSLMHGFIFSDLMGLGIGIYLPLAFVLLYELTGSLLAPETAWLLFLAI